MAWGQQNTLHNLDLWKVVGIRVRCQKLGFFFPSAFLTKTMKSKKTKLFRAPMSQQFQNGMHHCRPWAVGRKHPWQPRELISSGINITSIWFVRAPSWVFSDIFLHQTQVPEAKFNRQSDDHGKEGHFWSCKGTNTHLPLTRDAQPSGQLSLYLLNDLNSLWSEFTKGIIALTVGHL